MHDADVCFLSLGNVYIGDTNNQRIRKVTISTGIISTIAGSSTSGSFSGDGGAATSATLYGPEGVALDSSGIIIIIIIFIIIIICIHDDAIVCMMLTYVFFL